MVNHLQGGGEGDEDEDEVYSCRRCLGNTRRA